ncbi:MAG: LON peptidase substrate-binding domain-containing protein, partial [Candidatus Limnocylindrus sp.]
MTERTEREIQADLDEELNEEEQLAIDEAVAASDDDTVVPRGRGSFPLGPLREIVIFPEMVAPLKVGRDKSVAAIRAAAAAGGWIALVTQREPEQEEITSVDQLHAMGTLAKIAQVVNLPDGTLRAVVQGQRRLKVKSLDTTGAALMLKGTIVETPEVTGVEVEALMRSVQAQVETYVTSGAPVPPEAAVAAKNITDPGLLADM